MKIKTLREFKKFLKEAARIFRRNTCRGILMNGNSVKLMRGNLFKNMSKTNLMLENYFVFGYDAAYFDG